MIRSIVFVILIVNSFSLINCDENLTNPFLIYTNFCSMVKNSTIAPIESLCISYVGLAKTLEDLSPKNEYDLLTDCKKTLPPSELNEVIKSCSEPHSEASINKVQQSTNFRVNCSRFEANLNVIVYFLSIKGADCVKKLGYSKKFLSKKPLDAILSIKKTPQLRDCVKNN
ncbi:uncharacterized protein LOC128392400 isoform X1 [Panonychus citri]|uniref:uncharacterized protein LOC128392400 isoform X1 n=1 Tax=Panonychus citri TaxID=50023 RepID=UPI0023082E8F|nr:uncharacterized protein LOC128392400 isoform X1 [Panonychus citri]